MLRQGIHGRGIVATGVITRAPFTAPHWNRSKTGDAHYVNVAWHRAMDLNQMITLVDLEREVPGFAWNKAAQARVRLIPQRTSAAVARYAVP